MTMIKITMIRTLILIIKTMKIRAITYTQLILKKSKLANRKVLKT